jgi:hypothetical protein
MHHPAAFMRKVNAGGDLFKQKQSPDLRKSGLSKILSFSQT